MNFKIRDYWISMALVAIGILAVVHIAFWIRSLLFWVMG